MSHTVPLISPATFDRAATARSLSGLVPRAALPLAAMAPVFVAPFALPFAASEAQELPWLLTTLAIGASVSLIAKARTARKPALWLSALVGTVLIARALSADGLGLDEARAVAFGSLLLAGAPIYRLVNHQSYGRGSQRT